jgi:hypothetical protein
MRTPFALTRVIPRVGRVCSANARRESFVPEMPHSTPLPPHHPTHPHHPLPLQLSFLITDVMVPHTPPPCTLVLAPCECWASWMTPTPVFPPPNLRTHFLSVRWVLARCWVHMQASVYWQCCPGGCGEADVAGAGSWGVWKEGRALRAERVWVGVLGKVWG